MTDLLKNLNSAQKKAVTHLQGPLLLVAGAGTGKTTVLINRLAYLVLNKKQSTDNILLLTFTEKAAGEMEERADRILPYGYTDLWIHTFHGFSERILRDHSLEIGLNPDFKLLSETEQWVFVKKNLAAFSLDYYRPLGNPTKFISELLKHFSRLKDENITVDQYLKYAEKFKVEKEGDQEEKMKITELSQAYSTYNNLLLEAGYLDFGDLITYTIKLFKQRKNILQFYRQKFKYIMVDEFQDTNLAQYQLIKLLASPKNNLLVTGDDDQAIYKFRGASISNIMQFKEDYKEAQEVVLTDNYRSYQEILDAAYRFIQHNNPNRLEDKLKINKRLLAKAKKEVKKYNVTPVNFLSFAGVDDEVAFTVSKIKEIYFSENKEENKISFNDFAILVRANDTANAYVKELNRQDIPNQFMSWRGLYYKPIILDILAYFRLLDNYHESAALFRILSMDSFFISHTDMVAINKWARRKTCSLYEALQNIEKIVEVSGASIKNCQKLLTLIKEHSQLVKSTKPTKLFLHFVYDSGLLANLDRDRDLEQFSYLNQFYQKIKKLEESGSDLRLKDFLEAINLELEAGETGALKLDFLDNDTVKVMTVHGAKGLEFKYVFLVNLVDKKFPTIARSEKISIPKDLIKEKVLADKNAHVEEERRLFYVALTRAKKAIFLTAAKDYGGAREKKPSSFLAEMGIEQDAKMLEPVSVENLQFIKDLKGELEGERKKITNKDDYVLPARFSFSQLAAFSTCPLQYKFAFVLKIPVVSDKAAFAFGRSLHTTLCNFLQPLLSDKYKQSSLFASTESKKKIENALNKKRLQDLYLKYWQSDGYQSKEEKEAYFEKGKKVLSDFFQDYQENRPFEIIFLEKNFTFKIGLDVIKGTIDRVDRLPDKTLEIIDYKTGGTKEKLVLADKKQLILYQLFLEEYLQETVSKLTYYYLESGEKRSFLASEKEKIKIKEQIRDEIAAIKKRDFHPSPSPLCQFCDFRDICEFRQV
ncbi:MAG: UvrD-helicase domain-containing protein [Patescibacteria group bacterium]|nr:UvrD-helicase domain-containing protein [Patescibacteria group bacterium]MDD4443695.1 UvrD-helicase domain-containing protein [Patescibacteria group bacterium]